MNGGLNKVNNIIKRQGLGFSYNYCALSVGMKSLL